MSKTRAFLVLLFGINIGMDIILIAAGSNRWLWLGICVGITILLFMAKTGKYVKDE